MNYIKELFYGNLSPANQKIAHNSEYSRIAGSCDKLYKELKKDISDEDIKKLDRLCGYNFDLSALTAEENYILGFRDGSRLMLDILMKENENLIPM